MKKIFIILFIFHSNLIYSQKKEIVKKIEELQITFNSIAGISNVDMTEFITEYFISKKASVVDYASNTEGAYSSITDYIEFITSPKCSSFFVNYDNIYINNKSKLGNNIIIKVCARQKLNVSISGIKDIKNKNTKNIVFSFIISESNYNSKKFKKIKIKKIERANKTCNSEFEEEFWRKTSSIKTLKKYKEYLKLYPYGPHAVEAKEKIKEKYVNILFPQGGGRWAVESQWISFNSGVSKYNGDIESNFNPLFCLSYRNRYFQRLSFNLSYTFSVLSGDDKNSKADSLKNRNLNFNSKINTFSITASYYVLPEKNNPRYSFSSRRKTISAYLFSGIGFGFYNPYTYYNGKKYYLSDLHTEGQGINNKKEYKKTFLNIPFGVGVSYKFSRIFAMNLIISYNFTTSDYIDDVSGKYYNKELIRDSYGDIAAELSDRRIIPTNEVYRGNPDYNDGYSFILVGIEYCWSCHKFSRLPTF